MEKKPQIFNFWITLSDQNHRIYSGPKVKATKNKPSPLMHEIAFQLSVMIPDSYFKRPMFSANIELPEREPDNMNLPIDIKGVENAILEQTGLVVNLKIQEP